jgi:molybdopterin-biosynthesis enzyme MoeA-like protein
VSVEQSIVIYGSMEATLTPLMERIEKVHQGVKVFSLPSVDHPVHGRHIELGVKGEAGAVATAYVELVEGVKAFGFPLGPELVR